MNASDLYTPNIPVYIKEPIDNSINELFNTEKVRNSVQMCIRDRARILQAIKIDYIDESEVLSPADDKYHINKNDFKVQMCIRDSFISVVTFSSLKSL